MILVLGATGFIGSRLVDLLLREGFHVRAGARSLERLVQLPFSHHSRFEAVAVDVIEVESLVNACEGVDVVVYLVHSMGGKNDFSARDRVAAGNMVNVAEKTGVSRMIYLSGLGDVTVSLSKHLQSRTEVGEILSSGAVPVTILRAAMVIGNGSGSYEILRYLTERLPALITPRWVRTRVQPIAITDVLNYIAGCIKDPGTSGKIFDIGGPDILNYEELMRLYAREAGLTKRLIIPVPVFSPKLSSYWIHLITPIHSSLAVPLAEGLSNEVICLEQRIRTLLPISLTSCREAIDRTLDWRQFFGNDQWRWEWIAPNDPAWAGGTVYRDIRIQEVDVDASVLWTSINSIDRLDFWEELETIPGQRLLLRALVKLPGRAFLEYRFEEVAGLAGRIIIRQQVVFIPRGLWGLIYWKILTPVRAALFPSLLQRFVRRASFSSAPESGR